jgi:hypothetical protein
MDEVIGFSIVAGVVILVSIIIIVFKKAFKVKRSKMETVLTSEVNRAKRAGRSLGFVLIEICNSVPRGISEYLPGRTLMVNIFENAIRNTDMLERTDFRIYSIILTETREREGAVIAKDRIHNIAKEMGWGDIKIGLSSFPEDGGTAKELISSAAKDGQIMKSSKMK